MKRIASLAASFLVIVGLPCIIPAAGSAQNPGPEIIKFKMGDLYLNFQHWKHQKSTNNECFHCHNPQEWKIKEWDKEIAHQLCIACHDLNDNGPVECKGCHSTSHATLHKDDKKLQL
jgi:hypothetical protein